MESFFGGNGKADARMDRTGFQKRNGIGMGSVSRRHEAVVKRPFEKALAEVTAENTAAHRSAHVTKPRRDTGCAQRDNNAMKKAAREREIDDREYLSEELRQLLADSMVNEEGIVSEGENASVLIPDEIADNAEAVIRETLAVLSEALGIQIFGNLEEFSLKEVGSDTQKQFAEIVFTLKKMLQAFEFSREQGMPVELPSGTVEGEGIDALSDVLRVSAFKIEVACTMLGIAESVQKQVAVQMEVYQASGIIQATDPSTLVMAARHTERLFKGLFTDEQGTSELSTLVQQVKKLLAENSGEVSVSTASSGEATTAKADLRQFDAEVYRALLKIDKMSKVEQQNGSAVIGEEKTASFKLGQLNVPIAQEPSEVTSPEQAESATVLQLQPGMQQGGTVGTDVRMAGALMRMTDETVMEQINAKLQTVLRSGMSEVRIQLRPESLGEVSMRIRMEGDVVLAKIEVQNQQVKEIMERNLPMLKDALAQQNINAGTFDVQVNNGSGRHFGNMPNSPWNEEETARQGLGGERREDDHGAAREHGHHPDSETGRRFGSNSVEYFA
jgi:flagellar hook-length control protein FliK